MSRQSTLITGAGRGLGRELTRVFLKKNWRVFPLVRNESAASALAEENPEYCRPIIGDVTSDRVAGAIKAALNQHPQKLNVLINNAGIPGWTSKIDHVRPEEVSALLDVHCLGVIRCTKAARPFLKAARQSLVINMSSRFGSLSRNSSGELRSIEASYSYRIAKAAQNMLTICLSQELASDGISVCALHPGQLKTASSAADADTEPYVAAGKICEWIHNHDNRVNGGYFDLFSGSRIDW